MKINCSHCNQELPINMEVERVNGEIYVTIWQEGEEPQTETWVREA